MVDEVNLSPKDFPGVHVCLFYIYFLFIYFIYILDQKNYSFFFSFLAKPYPGE